MHVSKPFVSTIALLMAVAGTAFAQDERTEAPHENLNLQVEITTQKKTYTTGEPIRFRASLVNRGMKVVYVANNWGYAGGGVAGFYIHVKQLTGKLSNVGCTFAGDRSPAKDSRPPEQILHEDFVRLAPGQFVGFERKLRDCPQRAPGTYQIIAEYSPNDFNTHQVVPLSDDKNVVLVEKIESQPWTFCVRRTSEASKPSSK